MRGRTHILRSLAARREKDDNAPAAESGQRKAAKWLHDGVAVPDATGSVMFRWRFGLDLIDASVLLSAALLWGWGGAAGAFAAKKADRPTCSKSSFRVVLDVGHTAERPGALSARGVPEYEFNVRLAKQIERTLVEAGFRDAVLLITSEAPSAGLFKRVAYANRLPADLLLSIHHDAVPERLLETWKYEGSERHFSDRWSGHSIFISNDNSDRAGSLQFGNLLGRALKDRGLQYTAHYTEAIMGKRRRELIDAEAGVYRYDELVVLRESRMPAVLLEAGSIVHRDEELQLATPERQSLIAAGVTEAVENFCALRAQRTRTVARRSHSSHAVTARH